MDTSAAILVMRGKLPPSSVRAQRFGISTVVELELQLGVFHGGGRKEGRRVAAFLSEAEIFDFDRAAAKETARVLSALWKKGEPIGDFDAQIAGHSLALAMPLLTDNVRHFGRVQGLQLIPWAAG